MVNSDVTRWTQDPEEMRVFQQERLVVEVTELMCKTMRERGVKRGQLAEQLNRSRGRISQILNGETNPTLHTVADVFTALGKTLVVSAEDLFVERALLRCIGTMTAANPREATWQIEPLSTKPCGNLTLSG
jgi:transcriptional regulator with XRE-family HTH domain